MAYDMADAIGCDPCCEQFQACEEHHVLWIRLGMLFSMNQQAYVNTCEQEVFRSRGHLVNTHCHHSVEVPMLTMDTQKPSPTEEPFAMLHSKLLEVSDKIMYSTRHGLLSAWSLLGLVGQLSYIEPSLTEFSNELSASDPPFEVRAVQLDILKYTFHYLLLCAYMSFLEKYLHGDTAPHTSCYAARCVESAEVIRRISRPWTDCQHCKAFGWYFRGFGKYYAVVAERTLGRVKGWSR